MKNSKWIVRIALLLLICTMVLSAVACNQTPADGPGTDPVETDPVTDPNNSGTDPETDPDTNPDTNPETDPETDPEADASLPELNMGGREFTVLLRTGDEYINDIGIMKVFESSSSIDRAVYTRNRAVMDKYNMIFNFKQTGSFSSDVSTGRARPDQYGILVGMGREIFSGIIAGYYADWNDLEHVDLTQPYWAQSAIEQWSTPAGKIFAMNGDLSYMSVGNSTAMFFNKSIISEVGVTSPYQLVYDDAWTVEAFIQMVTDCDSNLDGDGSGSALTDTFGYATERWRGPGFVTFCGGVGALEKKSDGTYKIGIAKESVADVIQDYIDMIMTTDVALYGSLGDTRNAFQSGRAAFLDDNVKCAVNFSGTALDFGILPWPKASKRGDYVSPVGSGTNTFAVYGNMSEQAMKESSAVLEAMACYGQRDVLDYYYGTVLSYQGTKDEDSLAMMKMIHDALFYDFAAYSSFGGIADVVQRVIEDSGTYGGNIYTAISHLEEKTMIDLELWYLLDLEE